MITVEIWSVLGCFDYILLSFVDSIRSSTWRKVRRYMHGLLGVMGATTATNLPQFPRVTPIFAALDYRTSHLFPSRNGMGLPISQLHTGSKMVTSSGAPSPLLTTTSLALTLPRPLAHHMLVGVLYYAPGGKVAVKETILTYTVKRRLVLSGDRYAILHMHAAAYLDELPPAYVSCACTPCPLCLALAAAVSDPLRYVDEYH